MPNRGPSGEHTIKVRLEELQRITDLKTSRRYKNLGDLVADMLDVFEGKLPDELEQPRPYPIQSVEVQRVIDWWTHPQGRQEEAIRRVVRIMLENREKHPD